MSLCRKCLSDFPLGVRYCPDCGLLLIETPKEIVAERRTLDLSSYEEIIRFSTELEADAAHTRLHRGGVPVLLLDFDIVTMEQVYRLLVKRPHLERARSILAESEADLEPQDGELGSGPAR
jgi:hypothetical protein